jgi:putative FmdB family regulatory protein
MPTYEYRCKSCDHHFTEVQTLSEHEKGLSVRSVTATTLSSSMARSR